MSKPTTCFVIAVMLCGCPPEPTAAPKPAIQEVPLPAPPTLSPGVKPLTDEEIAAMSEDILGRMARSQAIDNDAAAEHQLSGLNSLQDMYKTCSDVYGTLVDVKRSPDSDLASALRDHMFVFHEREDGVFEARSKGYVFEMGPSTTAPSERYWAAARPIEPGKTGSRFLFTGSETVDGVGDLRVYEGDKPFEIDKATCAVPPGLKKLDK